MPTLHRAEGWRHLAAALSLSLTLSACGQDQPADLADTDPDADVSDVGEDSGHETADTADVEPDPYAQLPPQPWPVHERGHYGIGYSLQSLTYLPRGDDEIDREIQISIWYPTLDSEGRRARYLNALNAPGVLQDPGVAIRDEEPAPLMIFSHGNGSFGVQSYFFAEYLASHGFVVIGPDHKGNTFADTGGAVQLGSTLYRPQDMSAVLDWIEQLPEDHALFGKTSSKIAISGHSLGGFTTLASTGATLDLDAVHTGCENATISSRICQIFENEQSAIFADGFLDERFKVALPMTPAGAEIYVPGVADITTPTLMWTAGQDLTLPNEEEGDPLWNAMVGSQHRRIDITNAGHFTYSNLCALLGTAVPEMQDDGCSETNMGYEEAFFIINAYSLAFLRLHLDGDTSYEAMLDGESPLSPSLAFDRKD